MTDEERKIDRRVANSLGMGLSIGGFYTPPSRFTFFDGDSTISLHRDGKLELGPAWVDAGDAAAAFFDALVTKVVPSWNARAKEDGQRIAKLEAALRMMLDLCAVQDNRDILLDSYSAGMAYAALRDKA